MPYRDFLNRWLVVRLLPDMRHIVVATCRNSSDAEGYLKVLRRLLPGEQFIIVFDSDPDSPDPKL
ncbi:hypothetical protein ACKFKG_17795 [Phormidesmis sp. 146-35]